MDTATKAGARHSASDMTHINHAFAHAKAIMEHAAALGAAEDTPEVLPTKAVPAGADPVLFAAQECGDIQMAAGALWTLATLLQSETFQDDEGEAPLIAAARQLIAYISGELDDVEGADTQEDVTDPTTGDMLDMSASYVFDGTLSYKDADTMIYAGDAVKALPAGHVGGYLVRFSTPNDPDLAGEYFTKDTDFGIKSGDKTHVWFHHRGAFKTRDGRTLRITDPIGEGTLKIDDTGVFVDAVLYNRAQYEAVLSDLGWSSGTASHLVDAVPGGKATWLKRWYLGLDATLTFGPCEPRNVAIPLKSLAAAELPFSPDTKGTDTLETLPETDRSSVVQGKALSVLVHGYMTSIDHNITRRYAHHGRK